MLCWVYLSISRVDMQPNDSSHLPFSTRLCRAPLSDVCSLLATVAPFLLPQITKSIPKQRTLVATV